MVELPKKQQQCLIPRYLLKYLEDLQITHTDPTESWGSTYTAGTGIKITDNTISVNSTVVALKSDLTKYVTTNTTQNINSTKRFYAWQEFKENVYFRANSIFNNEIQMYAGSGSNDTIVLFDNSKVNKGYLQYNSSQDSVYLGRTSSAIPSPTYAQNIGFLSEDNSGGYRVLMPNKTGVTGAATTTANTYYIPTEFTDGTNTVKATSEGILNISSLLPTIPTKTSDLTNDSGFITSSALTGYATESWVSSELLDYAELSDLSTVATTGDYNDLINKPTIPVVPTNVSSFTNDAGYITFSALNGYATESWVNNQNYALSSDIPTDYVDLSRDQDITGVKTFVGSTLAFRCDTNNTSGFKIYHPNGITEVGSLKVDNSGIGSITLSNDSSSLIKSYIGFSIQPNGSSNSYKFYMPYAYNADFQSAGYSTTGSTVFPFVFTDGSTSVKANSTGVVDLSSLNLGGSSYTAGTGIDITNDVISIDSTVVALKSDIPTVPTNVSSFTNDAGYITNSVNNLTNYTLTSALATVATSGSYADLSNKPSIPSTATSTSTSTVTPSTIQLTFTFEDDTTQTVTLMTGATVSTTTTTTLS